MSSNTRAVLRAAVVTALIGGGQLIPVHALADDTPQQGLHNITYRARIDGVSRGAMITYNINDSQDQSANPTMLPGRTFEAQTVLADPQHAGMEVSVKWPYSANLHCEILVDDATTAQADQFVAPRVLPANDDPGYGVLQCGAPINAGGGAAGNAAAAAASAGGAAAGGVSAGGAGGPSVAASGGPGNVVNTAPIAGPLPGAPPAS